jgi:hypothetical protein
MSPAEPGCTARRRSTLPAECQALNGELGALEPRWREAEEIAAIADDLLIPTGLRGRRRALRAKNR